LKLNLSEEQQLLVDTFRRMFADLGGGARARERFAPGLDRELLETLGALGALAMRSELSDMGEVSLFEAVLLLEEAGRVMASAPLAETLIVCRLLGHASDASARSWHDRIASGAAVASLALLDAAVRPDQLVHFGADADVVLARVGDRLCLFKGGGAPTRYDHGDYRLAGFNATDAELIAELARGPAAAELHAAAVEEWKLLVAAELCGMASASLDLAVAYAKERHAFGRPIGSFQAIAHPLADRAVDIEGGRLLTWWAAWLAARKGDDAPAAVSMAFAWMASAADQATRRALHTFGGYGLSREHDAQLYFRRAKARAVLLGDPGDELAQISDRTFRGATAPTIPTGDVGIDFDLGPEAERVAADLDRLFQKLMTPERGAKMVDSYDGHNPEISTALAAEGLLYADWPTASGGRGAGFVGNLAALRTWQKHDVAPHAQTVTSMVGQILMRFGSEEMRNEALPKIASGQAVCCMGYSEPGSGSDIFAAQTRAAWDEERRAWIINGQKMWTTGANLADYILILTRTEPGSARHRGLTLFFVPMSTPGIEVYPIHTVMDERSNATFYTDVVVPDKCRIGEPGGGLDVMAKVLPLEQAGVYGPGDRRVLSAIVEWARTPRPDGGSPFDEKDVRKRVAKAALVAQVGDLLSMRGAWFADAFPDAGRTAYGPMAKHFYGDASQTVYADLMDLAAPETLLGEPAVLAVVEHLHRQIQVATVYGGTSEVQRSQIAEVFLGLPKSR